MPIQGNLGLCSCKGEVVPLQNRPTNLKLSSNCVPLGLVVVFLTRKNGCTTLPIALISLHLSRTSQCHWRHCLNSFPEVKEHKSPPLCYVVALGDGENWAVPHTEKFCSLFNCKIFTTRCLESIGEHEKRCDALSSSVDLNERGPSFVSFFELIIKFLCWCIGFELSEPICCFLFCSVNPQRIPASSTANVSHTDKLLFSQTWNVCP